MDDIEEPVVSRQADTRLSCLFLGAGVFVAGQLVEKDILGLLEPYAVPGGITGSFIAILYKAAHPAPSTRPSRLRIYLLGTGFSLCIRYGRFPLIVSLKSVLVVARFKNPQARPYCVPDSLYQSGC